MKKIDLLNIAFVAVLTIAIGFTTGYTVGVYQTRVNSFPEIPTISDINPGITTIQMLEVRDGEMIGKVTGRNARLAYSPDGIVELQEGAFFKIPINEVNLSSFYQAETIPDDVNYIASSEGAYYYHLLDKKAFGITPENRMYFRTSEEAEESGYKEAK